jgi:hypothetical protein
MALSVASRKTLTLRKASTVAMVAPIPVLLDKPVKMANLTLYMLLTAMFMCMGVEAKMGLKKGKGCFRIFDICQQTVYIKVYKIESLRRQLSAICRPRPLCGLLTDQLTSVLKVKMSSLCKKA